MLILIQLINQMHKIGYSENAIMGALQDLEANAFAEYVAEFCHEIGFEDITERQAERLCLAISKWESALEIIKMKRGA